MRIVERGRGGGGGVGELGSGGKYNTILFISWINCM